MPRIPKKRDGLSAGERVRIYEAEQAERLRRMSLDEDVDIDAKTDISKASVKKSAGDQEQVKAAVAIEKKMLPKPQHATVKVDFSISTGEIGKMHGMCNGPASYGADISNLFREIGVPQVRFDGTDGAISSYAVDVSRIFKDINADPNDPESYDFSYTDKYVTAAYNSGARVIYRLGESRDLLDSGKKINLPENTDLWINVCANVIRHYNDYFANGYAFGIEYFEIWSHDYSDNVDKNLEFEFYRRVASTIKIIDGGIKVGGMDFDGFDDAARDFVKYCKRNRVPLDFITFRSFDGDPLHVSETMSQANSYIKNHGLDSVELILGKWCYIDAETVGECGSESHLGASMGNAEAVGVRGSESHLGASMGNAEAVGECGFKALLAPSAENAEVRKRLFESQASIKGAAYAAAVMLELNSRGEVAKACFYDAQPIVSPFTAICDRFGTPQKPFYAFKAYGELYRAGNAGGANAGIYAGAGKVGVVSAENAGRARGANAGHAVLCESVQDAGYAHTGIYAGAAMAQNGECYVMIASYKGCGVVDLRLDSIPDNLYTAEIYLLDGVKDLTLGDSVPLSGAKKRLVLNVSEYGVVLVRLY